MLTSPAEGFARCAVGRWAAIAVAAAVLLLLTLAGDARGAFRQLPTDGSQVNSDATAGIDPARDAGLSDVAGGSLAGALEVPWGAFEQTTAGQPQIFVRAFKAGAWATQGNQGGTFPGSLNFDQTKQAEAPTIDFAGAGRTVPWATWYEDNTSPFNHKEIFASRFDQAAGRWVIAGQARGSATGPPSLNINTNQDAENPAVAGGTRTAGGNPGPWIAWQELDGAGPTDQIFVVRPMGPAAADCTGVKPAAFNPAAAPNGGFCWQQVGVERQGADPSLNIDKTRNGIEPDIAFTGPNDTVPWVVWYEKNPGLNGVTNELVFAAKANNTNAVTGTVDGGDHWEAVGNGTAAPQPIDTTNPCIANATEERKCALNKDPTKDAEDVRVAAGTMNPANPTVPWAVWDEDVGGVKQVFVSRLVGGTHFELANTGQPLSLGANDSTRPDITFSGNTPYVSWREQISASEFRVFTGHLVDAANPTFVLDTPGGLKVSAAGLTIDGRAPISSGCTATPFNGDGSTCQAGAIGTPFFLFTDGPMGGRKLFGRAYEPGAVTTDAATSVSQTGGTLNGSVDPAGARVSVHFDFGSTTGYGSTTTAQEIGPVNATTAFSAALTGLSASTVVHYRAVASSDFGSVVGPDQTFTTSAVPSPPVNDEPHARIVGLKSKVKSKKLKLFRGTASDNDGVARVQIAVVGTAGGAHVAAKKRGRCLVLQPNGGLKSSRADSHNRCTKLRFLTAKGTTSWTFKLKKRLPKGTYTIFARATDRTGKVETHFSKARGNRLAFKVN
jgi:hypothetical protein